MNVKSFLSILDALRFCNAGVAVLAVAVTCALTGCESEPDNATRIARGKRLVEQVGMCADCHTPRLPTGALDRTRWMHGAPLGFKPLMEMPWSPVAPNIAGLPSLTDEQALTFFTTGKRPSGHPALNPMHDYRLDNEDARNVIAYLRSLPPSKL